MRVLLQAQEEQHVGDVLLVENSGEKFVARRSANWPRVNQFQRLGVDFEAPPKPFAVLHLDEHVVTVELH